MKAFADLYSNHIKINLPGYIIVWSKYLTFIFKVLDQGITFVYCLNITFKDESECYGLIKMSPGNM
jgi:hypothetical protein